MYTSTRETPGSSGRSAAERGRAILSVLDDELRVTDRRDCGRRGDRRRAFALLARALEPSARADPLQARFLNSLRSPRTLPSPGAN